MNKSLLAWFDGIIAKLRYKMLNKLVERLLKILLRLVDHSQFMFSLYFNYQDREFVLQSSLF